MSNDGTATPEPGQEPDGAARPAPDQGTEPPAAPAPSGYEATGAGGPAPSGYEVPSSTTPTEAYPTQDAPTQAFPRTGDTPTQAYPTAGYPSPGQPTGSAGWPSPGQPAPSSSGQPGPGQPWAPQPAPGQPAAGQPWAPQPAPGAAPAASDADQPASSPYGAPAADASAGTGPQGYPQPGTSQPGSPQPGGYGQGGGYPPPGTPYGAAPYSPGQYPGPPPASTTDGVSIAALVTGILGMGLIPIVLGVLGLRRTKQNGTQGRGFAIAGIVLGGLAILATIGLTVAIILGISAANDRIDDLRDSCASGDMAACDDLYRTSDVGSDEEEFGLTCGGRTDGTVSCTGLEDGFTYGDNAELDTLWDACEGGDGAACDELYSSAPGGSEYEEFGRTCAGTADGTTYCDSGLTEDPATEDPGTEDSGTATGDGYGTDPELDVMWDACAAGDGLACDNLYWESPAGSAYEDFGSTCGNRVEFTASCEEELAAAG